MSDRSTPMESELAALADGSLEHADRERVLEQVDRSAQLRAALEEQRRAVQMVSAVEVRAPAALRARVQAIHVPERPRGLRRRPLRLATAVAIFAGAAVAVAITLSVGGTSSSSTVQRTAALTLDPATQPAPAESSKHAAELAASVEGVTFPYWRERFGWRSSGARSDAVDGRTVRTVFYADAQGRRVGYAIVSGPAWATRGGNVIWRGKVGYRVLSQDGATVVTWRRDDHLCVVSGRGVSTQTLLRLAGWSGERQLTS